VQQSVLPGRVRSIRGPDCNDHCFGFQCPDGNATFSVELARGRGRDAGITLYFETEDVEVEYARLTDAGVLFDQAGQDMTWLWREPRFRDPDGRWQCVSRRRLPRLR
jgi:hypothetical protein